MLESTFATPDLTLLLLISLATVLLTLPFTATARRRVTRIKIVVLAAMNFAYAGIGISFAPDLARFFLTYLVFLSALFTGLTLGSRIFTVREDEESAVRVVTPRLTASMQGPWWTDRIATVLATIYVVAILGQIVTTQGGIGILFDPMSVILDANKGGDIFGGRILRTQNLGFVLFGYAKLLSTPFFFIEMQRRLEGQWLRQLGVLLLVTYLGVVGAEQWGRGTFILPILTWLFTLLFFRRINGRTLTMLVVGGLALGAPVLNSIADWRGGIVDYNGVSLSVELLRLIEAEFFYPRFYPLLREIGESGAYFLPAVKWFISLPLPGLSWDGGFSSTRVLSEEVLGLGYGASGFYVLLPNWVGESLLVFGGAFWIWAFAIGAVIGFIDRFLASTPQLLTLDAYVTALMLYYTRSSGQEYVSQAFHMLTLLAVLYVISWISKDARKGSILGQ